MYQLPELCLVKIISFLDSKSINSFLEFLKNNNNFVYNNIYFRLNQIIRNCIPVIREIEYIHRNIKNINTTILFMKYYSRMFSLMRYNEQPGINLHTIISYKRITDKLNNMKLDNISQKDKKKFNHIVFTRIDIYTDSKTPDKLLRVCYDNMNFSLDYKILTDYISLDLNNRIN